MSKTRKRRSTYDCDCQKNFIGKRCETDCRKEPVPIDVIFIMDGSFSLFDHFDFSVCMTSSKNFKEEIDFISSIVETLDIDSGTARIGFMQFATKVDHRQELHMSESKQLGKAGILDHIRKTQWVGGVAKTQAACEKAGIKVVPKIIPYVNNGYTNTPAALWEAEKLLKESPRPEAKKFIFVITDGAIQTAPGSGDSEDAGPPAAALKASGAEIFAIGVGKRSRSAKMQKDLHTIANGKDDRVYQVEDFPRLKVQVTKVIKKHVCMG